MVEVSPAPGFVSALAGGHVFGAGGTPTGTVPSGSPFPFAGVSNVPGFTISTKSPIQTAAPKTNVGIPYSRTVPTVFAQHEGNLTTVCAGDPVFVCNKDSLSTRYTRGVDGTMRFTHVASVEYLNKELAKSENQLGVQATAKAKTQRKAILDGLIAAQGGTAKPEQKGELDERIEALEERGITPEITAAIKKLEAERDEISQRWGGAGVEDTMGDIDFLTLPVFQQWRLDGMLRSIDMDGEPRMLDGKVVNLTDGSVSTLLNVVVAGPARARVRDGDGLEQKFTYGPQNKKRHLVNVFDQLVLAVVLKEEKGKISYEIRRTTRSYAPIAPKFPRVGDGSVIADGVGNGANVEFENVGKNERVVAYWRLGRVVEELSSTDRTCGIVFDGSLVLVTGMGEGMREVSVAPFRER
jgi:hypothetical protein